ncbi:MAG TPA: ABC transporter permease [Patescibacteria group bacterium]|nr:ABC transporter permease [Patescibacteria group bacterium]
MSAVMRGNLRMALSGIRGAKWRSVLTMLGVIVGIVAVVLVVGIGEGVKRQIAGSLDHFGKDLIIVRPGQVNSQGALSGNNTDVLFGMSGSTSLTTNDVTTIQRTPGIHEVSPLGIVAGTPKAGDKSAPGIFVLATSSHAAEILNQRVEEGDFWGADNDNANVAVIGQHVASKLFNDPAPLGASFTFRGQVFLVRGVFATWVNVPFSPTANFDDAIFVPYQTAARLTHNDSGLYAVLAKTGNPKDVSTTANSLNGRMKQAHGGEQDFSVLGSNQSKGFSADVMHLLSVWIWAVAAISLFIGGVGIMNIMLLSVTERMHEIGVRKAIGATSRQILGQFMLEATVLSLVGGVIGMLASLGAVGLLYTYTNLKPVVSWKAMVIALGVSLVIGIVFGSVPAVKAARKDPIEALRHE